MDTDFEAQLEEMIRTTDQRLQVAQQNLEKIATEKRELEAAWRVFSRIKKSGDQPQKGNGAADPRKTQAQLVLEILENAAPEGLAPREIRAVAMKEHGREIPSGSLSNVLAQAQRAGTITRRNGAWSVPSSETPQPERPDPEERNDADADDSLI